MVTSKYVNNSDGTGIFWSGDVEEEEIFLAENPHWPNTEPISPKILTRKQAMIILKRYNLIQPVKQMVAAKDTEDGEAQIIFDNASTFDRDNALLIYVAGATGMTDAQLDQMFLEGSLL